MNRYPSTFKTDVHDLSDLLLRWQGGDPGALTELMPLVYAQLLEIARRLVRRESQSHRLDATGLVHEAYLRLAELRKIDWQDRAHFFAMCARIMRRVLIDRARADCRDKRGGGILRVTGVELQHIPSRHSPRLVALAEALGDLAEHDAQRAQIVELRFFGGFGRDEIARALGISSATVTRRWLAARSWLTRYLETEAP